MKKSFLSFMLISAALFAGLNKAEGQTNRDRAADIVKKMTLEEKAHLCVGMGMKMPGMNLGGPTVGVTEDKVPGAAGTTYPVPRLGVPSAVMADGPAGFRIAPYRNGDSSVSYYCTAWPVESLLASSWDVDLIRKVGAGFAVEGKAYGIDFVLGPGMNLHRNPLGGRNFEYYSEDPLLSGKLAAAMVQGVQSGGIGTSVKHFAANNNETNRNTINVIASERALREIYLRNFEIAIKEGKPWTVMSSYNKLNGPYTSEDPQLLTTLLRNEWGFQGIVMTDWFGGKDPVAQMKAGNDLLMPGTRPQVDALVKAVKEGKLDEKVLDQNANRILAVLLQTQTFKKVPVTNKPDLEANARLARKAAAEGIVLLKNEKSTLPLPGKSKRIAAFGNISYDFISGGTGSGDVNEAYTISLAEGLKNAGYELDKSVANTYTEYALKEKKKLPPKRFFFELQPPIPEMPLTPDLLLSAVQNNDVAILTIGRNAGEFKDRVVENDFDLTAAETKMISEVSQAFHAAGKKVVAILNVGGVVETASWRDQVDALVLAWQGGQEGGNAVTDVMTGKVNPSGKLPTTFPVKYTDVASSKNFPGKELPGAAELIMGGFMKAQPAEVVYEEGIYVGYRHHITFNIATAYEFGFGLSYTNFSYSNLRLSSKTFNGKITALVDITNTGKAAGKEIAQLYLTAPAGSLDKPAIELKGFAKTKLLKPGEKQTLSFELAPKELASYNSGQSSWIADAGKYEIKIGASSQQIRLQGSFELQKTLVAEKCNKILVPQVPIQEIKP